MLYNRGYGSVEYRSVEDLLTVAFTPEPALPKAGAAGRDADAHPAAAWPAPRRCRWCSTLPPQQDGQSEFRINGVPYWKATPFTAAIGETQLWTVKNDTEWDHPYHLHGYFFMVVDEHGQPVGPKVWKDTINVPMKSTVAAAGDLRRAARRVDDPLPHPRPRRRRPDGHGARRRRGGTTAHASAAEEAAIARPRSSR